MIGCPTNWAGIVSSWPTTLVVSSSVPRQNGRGILGVPVQFQ
jgi:hypothetical protein